MFCGCKGLKGRLVDFVEVLPLWMSQIDVLFEKVNPDTRQAAGGYESTQEKSVYLPWCWFLVISVCLHGR